MLVEVMEISYVHTTSSKSRKREAVSTSELSHERRQRNSSLDSTIGSSHF